MVLRTLCIITHDNGCGCIIILAASSLSTEVLGSEAFPSKSQTAYREPSMNWSHHTHHEEKMVSYSYKTGSTMAERVRASDTVAY